MLIDGKAIATTLYEELQQRTATLRTKGVTPKLAIILVGNDPASHTYVAQKEKHAQIIGATTELIRYPAETSTDTLLQKVRELNIRADIHGIIIQRPLPPQVNPDVLQDAIDDMKDVDGFKPGSPFHVPVVMAVVRILDTISLLETQEGVTRVGDPHRAPATNVRTSDGGNERQDPNRTVGAFLASKNVVLIGKGSTSGQPLIDYMREIGVSYQLIDSKTSQPEELTKTADVIISSVGKQHLIRPDMLKKGVILISVGLSKDQDGKLHSDYEEEEIADIASYYTATPGGVGPINVAMLLYNLITAAEQKIA